MEQLAYNLLFRWFVGLNAGDPVWLPTVFTDNRDRLLEGEIVTKLFGQVLAQAEEKGLTSDEHFSGLRGEPRDPQAYPNPHRLGKGNRRDAQGEKLRGLAPVRCKLLLSLTPYNLLHLRNVLAGIEAAAS